MLALYRIFAHFQIPRYDAIIFCARSSTDRASAFEAEGCGFDSCRAHFDSSPSFNGHQHQRALIVQRIGRKLPKLVIEVRFLMRAFERSENDRVAARLRARREELKTLSISRGVARARCERCTGPVRTDKRTRGPHDIIPNTECLV